MKMMIAFRRVSTPITPIDEQDGREEEGFGDHETFDPRLASTTAPTTATSNTTLVTSKAAGTRERAADDTAIHDVRVIASSCP